MKKQNTGTLRRVLSAIGRYKAPVFASFALAIVSVALTLLIPVLAGEAIDQITDTGVHFETMLPILTRILLCAGAASLIQWLMNEANNRVTFSVVRDLREQALKKIESLPLSYLDSHPHGEIVSRVIADADAFADGLLMGFTQLFTGAATILGTLGFMFAKSAPIAAVVVVITPLSLFVARFIARRTHDMFLLQSKTRGELTAYIDEHIGGAKVVKAYGREEKSLREFDEINGRLERCSLRATFFSSITNPATRFVNAVVYAGVGLTGALAVLSGGMTVGSLTCFLSYANQYTKPFNEISGVVTELQNAIACAARLLELIDAPAQPPEPEDAVTLENVRGTVALKDVCFSYVPEKKLIENFNLSVHPGQRVAIVGPTGCGKTTLINLLMRFYAGACARPTAWCFRRRGSRRAPSAKTSPWAGPTRPRTKSSRPRRPPTPIRSSCDCPTATTRSSARTAACCPKGRSSCYASPA